MKVYEDCSQSPDGWNVTATLTLEDDGTFSYSEGWADYTNVSLSGGAGGTWQRGHEGITFHAEQVYRPIYFPWEEGKELKAVEVGDALEFAHGWTLRPLSEHILKPRLHNSGTKPPPQPRASGSKAAKPAANPRVRPSVKPTVKHPVKPPAPFTPKSRFEPRAPSPELAALLRRWIDELSTGGPGNSISRLCKENDAIPLDSTEIYLWVLRTDGQVLCIDHESFARRAEPEEDAEMAYGRIAVGAKRHPELLELLPPEHRV